jgi:hypothetical protein
VKRRITPEQLQELTEEQKVKLREWWRPERLDAYYNENSHWYRAVLYSGIGPHDLQVIYHEGSTAMDAQFDYLKLCIPLLDMGQMVEFLQDNDNNIRYDPFEENSIQIFKNGEWGRNSHYVSLLNKDICDTLWKAVKAVL